MATPLPRPADPPPSARINARAAAPGHSPSHPSGAAAPSACDAGAGDGGSRALSDRGEGGSVAVAASGAGMFEVHTLELK